MKSSQKFKSISVFLVLLIASLACDLTGTPTPIMPTQTPRIQVVTATSGTSVPTGAVVIQPTPTQLGGQFTTAPTSQPFSSEVLSAAQKQQLARATVRIVLMKRTSGRLVSFGSGSGTILSKDGLILTNCHVADPVKMGYPSDENPDALVVELVSSEDQPPVPKYIARVLASDGTLDLAVIKVDKNLDGSTVNAANLNLPFVSVGNSDDVKFGDTLYIFGFPGIGGDTITYTTGNVSGFDSMPPIGNRAWIKTDATIAGGNSGGLASNNRGEIIGVPTRLGTSSATNMTDCRQIADTNGDGKIDDRDTCVPTGGFINAIRPVNWARSLIEAGRGGVAYVSPYKNPTAEPTKVGSQTSNGKFSLNSWTSAIDSSNCPTQMVQVFPSGTTKIYAVFQFSNMVKGATWSYRWIANGRQVASNQTEWKSAESGKCFSFSLENQGKALPDGEYKIEIYTGSKLELSGSATTSVGGKEPQPGNAVQLKGKTVDANNGNGIAGIYVFVLNPGVDPDEWLDTGADTDVYTYAQTDASGNFVMPNLLQRGVEYGAVAGNNKLGYRTVTGYIDVGDNDPAVISITIQLSK